MRRISKVRRFSSGSVSTAVTWVVQVGRGSHRRGGAGFGDVSALEEGIGDDVSSRSRSPDTLPAISNGSKRGGGSPTGSKHSAGGGAGPGLANLAAMRASRAQVSSLVSLANWQRKAACRSH